MKAYFFKNTNIQKLLKTFLNLCIFSYNLIKTNLAIKHLRLNQLDIF
jgi:hypothetical protein